MRFNFVNSFAYLLVGAFLYTIVTKFTDNPSIFINPDGIAVVCGGLVIAALASFPFISLMDAFKTVFKAMFESVHVPVDEAREIVRLATVAQRGLTRIEPELENIQNEFMKSGAELMLDGVTPKVFQIVMQKRISEYQERMQRSTNVMLTLSKFAPALGLAATVLGLVQLLGKLGDSDMSVLGLGMAVALSGTFYGIVIANLIFQPLAELIQTKSDNEAKTREMILDGLHSILERHEPLVIGELANSYLPDAKRIDFVEELEDITKQGAAGVSEAAA